MCKIRPVHRGKAFKGVRVVACIDGGGKSGGIRRNPEGRSTPGSHAIFGPVTRLKTHDKIKYRLNRRWFLRSFNESHER